MKQMTLLFLSFFIAILAVSVSAQTSDELNAQAVNGYLDLHPLDSAAWWLIGSGSESMLEKKMVEVNDLVNAYQDRIPPTTLLADYLAAKPVFRFGYFFGDSAYYPKLKNNPKQKISLSICFIPLSLKDYRPFITYQAKEKRLLIWGIDCPKSLFAALLFYGLQSAAADAPEKNFGEDRESAMTAANILNAASKGNFFNYLDGFLANQPGENSLAKISAGDLSGIDAKIGVKMIGRDLAQQILPIYVIALKSRLMLRKSYQR
ncbi:MAG: hypothetical protein PHE24_00795 [Patescibacteria group bacterium]|nr:hypothetical protein [Patescibacteria group bacterium]